jgi:hypothetical protein
MEHIGASLKLFRKFNAKSPRSVHGSSACAGIIAGVCIVAAPCHYSRARRMPFAEQRASVPVAGAQPQTKPVVDRHVAHWNPIWAYQFVQKCI